MIAGSKPRRHRWGDPVRFPYKTERTCVVEGCGITKVTRHEPGEQPWLEFYRNGERIKCTNTPPCTPMSRPELAVASESVAEVVG